MRSPFSYWPPRLPPAGYLVFIHDGCAHLFDRRDDLIGRQFEAALDLHRVRARGHVLRPSCTIACARTVAVVVPSPASRWSSSSFLRELRAHIFIRVFQFDFFGDGHAVVRDGGRAEFLVQRYVAALRAEGRRDGARQSVDAALQCILRIVSKNELLSHVSFTPFV